MKTRLLAAAAFALMLASPSLAQQMSAEEFASTAASSDMFEITSSSLARERATSEAVRDFANMMIADHTQASSELAAAAETAGVALPGGMIDKHAAEVESLKGLQGAEFDAAYIKVQTAAHEVQPRAPNDDSTGTACICGRITNLPAQHGNFNGTAQPLRHATA